MVIVTRFAKKLRVPSTAQIKHQFLRMWLALDPGADYRSAEARTPMARGEKQ